MTQPVEFIDWAERYPSENALQIAIRQSTYCPCGHMKQIGEANCGSSVHSANAAQFDTEN
jgi:hypothetical protein